jgi:hypothetical protein
VRRSATAIVVAVTAALAGGGVAVAATVGTVLGGRTSQGWPIVIELNKAGTQVVRVSAGLHLTCTSGSIVNLPDEYRKVAVSKAGKFSLSFGPTTRKNDNGTTTDFEGSITGKLNKARTKATGKWSFKGTDHDAAGTVTDTCDSAKVSWTAKA